MEFPGTLYMFSMWTKGSCFLCFCCFSFWFLAMQGS